MPVATSNNADTIRKDLKTLPDGYVVLRRLTWGEKIQRREMVSKFRLEMAGGKSKDMSGELNMVNEKATFYDFEHCIVEHNLEKVKPGGDARNPEDLVPLDFNKMADFRSLDPRVGEEIDTLLSELNNFEDDDEEGN